MIETNIYIMHIDYNMSYIKILVALPLLVLTLQANATGNFTTKEIQSLKDLLTNSEAKEGLFEASSYIQRNLAPGFWNIQLFDNQTLDAGVNFPRTTSSK